MTQSPDRQALAGDTSDATGAQNPYDRAKVYVAYGYGLTGAGVKVGIVDSGFNLVNGQPQHNEFTSAGKITVLQSTAPLQSDAHGAHVSGLAVGDRNGTAMMGVAYNAALYLGMAPSGDVNSTASNFTSLFNEYLGDGVTVSSNSYGVPINGNAGSPWHPVMTSSQGYEVTARNAIAYRDANGLTSAQMLATIQGQTAAAWTQAIASMRAYQQAGGVIVFANSNYGTNDTANGGMGLDDADLMAALPAAVPELQGGWITVVNGTSTGLANRYSGQAYVAAATAKEGNVVLLSAPCGIAASFCLTMDGAQLYSASNTGVASYTVQTGTSQATPQVAGMVALLREAFPTASAADLAARLMYTADNGFFATSPTASTVTTASYTNANGTITGKVSNIWGHGFPDMQAALKPVGAVTVRSKDGTTMSAQSLAAEKVQLGGALGNGTAMATTPYLVNDVLNGVFASRLAGNFAASPSRTVTTALADSMLNDASSEVQTAGGTSIRFGLAGVPDERGAQNRRGTLFSLSQRMSENARMAFGMGFSADTMLGFAPRGGGLRGASFSDRAMGLPFLSLGSVRGQRWLAGGWQTGGISTTIAAFGSGADRLTASRTQPYGNRGRTQGMVVDSVVGGGAKRFGFNLSVGLVHEKDGFLGSQANSGFFSATGDSRFVRAGFTARLAGPIGLRGNYVTALTQVTPVAGGAFGGFSRLRSEAAAMALTADGLLGSRSQLTLGASQPLRVAAGRASFNLPQGVRINAPGDYSYLYLDKGVPVAASGREIDYMAEYSNAIAARSNCASRAWR